MGHWGTCPLEFANYTQILQPFKLWLCLSFCRVQLARSYIVKVTSTMWQTVAKSFSHIRFCRPNARWLSFLGDFVTTTNFGTRAPRARALPPPFAGYVVWPYFGQGTQLQSPDPTLKHFTRSGAFNQFRLSVSAPAHRFIHSFIHIRLLVCMTHRNKLWYRLHCW